MTPECVGPTSDFRCLEELCPHEVAERLELEPHREGGFFRETYRSPVVVAADNGPRPASTAILYLLTADDPSRFHRLRMIELWFYHAGAPAELFVLSPPAATQRVIGLDCPQLLVPANTWTAARVLTEDEADWGVGRAPERRWTADRRAAPQLRWTLVSCVVAPGFTYDDFELADRAALLREFPQERAAILALT
jgi:predicted cupin superfamily sugar epimerase